MRLNVKCKKVLNYRASKLQDKFLYIAGTIISNCLCQLDDALKCFWRASFKFFVF